MTFCSENQKKSEIIKKVEHSNNNFKLYYLDGNVSSFFNNDKDFITKLEEKLIEQAKERDKLDYICIKVNKWGYFILSLASINLIDISLQNNLIKFACIGFILSFCIIDNYRKNMDKNDASVSTRFLL